MSDNYSRPTAEMSKFCQHFDHIHKNYSVEVMRHFILMGVIYRPTCIGLHTDKVGEKFVDIPEIS